MKQLTKNLYAETEYSWANVGAAVTEAGVVMLDCPVRPIDSRAWQEKLHPLSPLGVRYLVSTDFHGDHTTGAAWVKDVTFIAPELVFAEVSKGDNAFSKEIFVETLRDQGKTEEATAIAEAAVPLPQICFDDRLILHLPPLTLDINRLGGHSPASSLVYIPEEGVLFSGDVIINGNPGMRDADWGQCLQALDWAESLPIEIIVPGHGPIGGKEILGRLKEHFGGMMEIMKRLIQAGQSREMAVADESFNKYFKADASRGQYWLQQRKETFRIGLERLYDQLKGE